MNDSTKGLISSERVGSAILSRVAPRRRYGLRSAAPAGARDRDRARRPARPGRAAALVVGLALLGAAPAEAQTARVLVSNVLQTGDDSANTSGNDHAQLFHTGVNAGGYTLTGVVVNSDDVEDDDFDVEICGADTTANEFPTSTCTALTPPASFAGVAGFTHTGLALSANTNYVMVIKQRGTGSVELDSTTSSGEDAAGLSDWSIKNTFYWNDSGTWTVKSGANEALSIIVQGYAVVPVVTPPVVTPPVVGSGTEIWSATLTVGTRMIASVTFLGWNDSGDFTGASLTDQNFTFGGDTYDLDQISLEGGALTLIFDTANVGDIATQATRNKLTLLVGSDSFNLGAGTLASNQRTITWTGTSLSWSASDSIALRITDDSTPVTIAPDVSSVEFTSTPPNPAYAIGGVVETTVNFSAAVDITGTPQLELDFAGTPIAIDCVAVTNTTWMGCSYEVVAGDSAPNGVAIAADKLTLNGGTITATGSTTITADLAHAAVAIDAAHTVDGIRPTLLTTGDDAPTTSTDGTQVILTFSEDISAVMLGSVSLEANATSGYEQGATVSRSGRTVTLTLLSPSLTIAAGWTVTVALSADAVDDAAGNGNLALGATTVTNAVGSTTAPTVSGVALTSNPGSNNTYAIGDAVEATVTFDAAVDITAAPQLELDFDGTAKAAACTTATNTTTMVCEYEVVAGDSAPNGIAIGANTLTGGTIYATGSTTTTADLDHSAVAINAGHKVDGIRPTLVTTGTDAPRTSTDGTQVILTFSEDVVSPDRGAMTIRAGGNVVSTSAASANGPRVDLTLTTALTSSTVVVTVALSVDAVLDTANNGNLAVSATAVTNAVGTTTASTTAPDAPTNLTAEAGDRQVTLSWTAPASDGGETITRYEYEQNGSGTWISTGGTVVTYTVRNLTNGQPYTFKVRAVNDIGASDASDASPSVTPAREPNAPTGLGATADDEQVTLNWTAPASDGGAAITDYEYEPNGSGTWTSTGGTTPSTTVFNLTNGLSYTFKVRAVNDIGASDASDASPSVTPAREPDAPTGLTATIGDQRVELRWTAPASNGATILRYEYELDFSGTWTSTGSTATNYTVRNLTNDQFYDFRVRAVNSAGASGASGSQSATPTSTEPDAPQRLRSTPGNGQVTLRWTAPANDGGEPITHYEYEQDFSGNWISTGSAAPSTTVTGLNNGQTYTFRVRAVNDQGAGDVVALQATPSPSTSGGGGGSGGSGGGTEAVRPPSPPSDLRATAGDQAVELSWRRPADDGGARIARYEYRQQDGDGPVGPWQIIGADPPPTTHRVTGLMNGTSYTFQVRAVNSREASLPSEPASATPGPELAPFEVTIVGVPEVAVAGESYELTAQSDAEQALVYAWRVAYGEGGSVEPTDTQTVVWTAPSGVNVAWIRVEATREDGVTAGQSAYVRVDVPDAAPEPDPDVPEPVPALPLLGQLLLALGLTGAGARLLSRRPRVPPGA